jgi:choline dehydrogenase-like flavoprotein
MPGSIRNSLSELRMLLRGLSPKQARARSGQIFAAALASAREVGPLAWRYMRHKRIGTVLRGEALLRVSIEQRARAGNRITLSPTRRDSRGVPAAQVNWTRGEEEGRAFLDMTRKVAAWAERNSIARVEMEPLLAENPAAFALAADDGLHHSGGARMALRATDGVVDTGLKVFGTRNLYCCGASVFPRSGFANPTFTAMALAVRLGERLLEARQP